MEFTGTLCKIKHPETTSNVVCAFWMHLRKFKQTILHGGERYD